METKFNLDQVLVTVFFVAAILTFARGYVCENRIYFGIFAFIVYLLIAFISQKLFRD